MTNSNTKRNWILGSVGLVSVIGIVVALVQQNKEEASSSAPTAIVSNVPSVSPTPAVTPTASPTASSTPLTAIREPVADFKARITKKPFGMYSTPATSPIANERFTGYHTGVDAEYTDVAGDVPVYAMADGTVLTARTADGYGGVVAIQHTINGQKYIGVYGHVDLKTAVKTGATVTAGQQIAILGDGESAETDGERKHLHLSVVKGTTLTIAGYTSTQAGLSQWIDPVSLF